MRYRLLGIDLDKTLLDSGGEVPAANIEAIDRAQKKGLMVVPCTGRAWGESRMVIDRLPGIERGIFVCGASICETRTGRSLDIATIEPHLGHRLVQFMSHLPEAVLVFREANLCGHDYLVTGQGELTANTRWWFEVTNAAVHFQRDVGPDDLHHTMRIGVVAAGSRVEPLTDQLKEAFGDQVLIQSFAAIQMPEPDESVHILEVFAAGVDKWRGLAWIAGELEIDASQIAVLGDEINDITMIRSSGCGIAMGNAIEEAKQVADRITLGNDEAGVAHAIDRLLEGDW